MRLSNQKYFLQFNLFECYFIMEVEIIMAKKYRLGYDYLFLSNESFLVKEELISGLSINVLFKVFDKNGNEVLFESDELIDQRLYFENGNSCYLSEFFRCFFDEKEGFVLEPNILLLRESTYTISTEINSYMKDINTGEKYMGLDISEPCKISKEEFEYILFDNKKQFDNSDNYPAQSTSYFTYELKDDELPEVSGLKYPEVEPRKRYVLEIVRNIEPVFKYATCDPLMVANNLSSSDDARKLAAYFWDTLEGNQFFLLTLYDNDRVSIRGKLYI